MRRPSCHICARRRAPAPGKAFALCLGHAAAALTAAPAAQELGVSEVPAPVGVRPRPSVSREAVSDLVAALGLEDEAGIWPNLGGADA